MKLLEVWQINGQVVVTCTEELTERVAQAAPTFCGCIRRPKIRLEYNPLFSIYGLHHCCHLFVCGDFIALESH
jgi:hypothetical protein